eukprot:scaffold10249_cov59-Cyclotella_meneghiniana.AAC.16
MKGAALFLAFISINASYEGFHDLDQSSEAADSPQQEEVAAAANHEARLIGLESVPDIRQSHEQSEPKNIINRFSQIITRQVMNRFDLHQLRIPTFPFQHGRRNSKPGSIALNDINKVSLANMNNMKKIGALCPPENNDSDDASSIDDESLVVCEPDAENANTITVGDCSVSDEDRLYQNPVEDDDEIQAGMIVYVLPSSDNHFNEADVIPEEDYDLDTSMTTNHDESESR